MLRFIGIPIRLPPRIWVSGKVYPVKAANLAATLFAIPTTRFASCTRTGTFMARAAR